jgi:hypothetical protein
MRGDVALLVEVGEAVDDEARHRARRREDALDTGTCRTPRSASVNRILAEPQGGLSAKSRTTELAMPMPSSPSCFHPLAPQEGGVRGRALKKNIAAGEVGDRAGEP